MCTVSVITISGPRGGFRVVSNRDEARSRPVALPPRWRDLPGGVRAVWPVEPQSGGTWIGANDRGLVLALLNLNLEPAPALPHASALRSRGLVIPALAGAAGVEASGEALRAIDLSPFAPFRLVAFERGDPGVRGIECRWDRTRLSLRTFHGERACFASSGLGDSRAAPRLPLFARMVREGATPADQDAFHAHAWDDRPEVSVRMRRPDARTVSVTGVVVHHGPRGAVVHMTHQDVPDDQPALAHAPPRPGSLCARP